jgi:thiosulfate/3-mercaptopyruvate sulfurtransferase
MVVDYAAVKARHAAPDTVLIDARTANRYRGDDEPIDPIAGHIPGAVNSPWLETTDARGWVRSPQEQSQRWQALPSAAEYIVYCGSGVTACVNLLAMHIAGIAGGRLYAGSWSDWCSYPENQNSA